MHKHTEYYKSRDNKILEKIYDVHTHMYNIHITECCTLYFLEINKYSIVVYIVNNAKK